MKLEDLLNIGKDRDLFTINMQLCIESNSACMGFMLSLWKQSKLLKSWKKLGPPSTYDQESFLERINLLELELSLVKWIKSVYLFHSVGNKVEMRVRRKARIETAASPSLFITWSLMSFLLSLMLVFMLSPEVSAQSTRTFNCVNSHHSNQQ